MLLLVPQRMPRLLLPKHRKMKQVEQLLVLPQNVMPHMRLQLLQLRRLIVFVRLLPKLIEEQLLLKRKLHAYLLVRHLMSQELKQNVMPMLLRREQNVMRLSPQVLMRSREFELPLKENQLLLKNRIVLLLEQFVKLLQQRFLRQKLHKEPLEQKLPPQDLPQKMPRDVPMRLLLLPPQLIQELLTLWRMPWRLLRLRKRMLMLPWLLLFLKQQVL